MLSKLKNKIKPQQIVNASLQGVTIKIVRSRRKKTLAVKVSGGDVSVLVPERTSLPYIEALIEKKSNWIQKKLLQQEQCADIKQHRYHEGECFLYLGVERTLKLVTGVSKNIVLDESSITLYSRKPLSSTSIKNRLKRWFQSEAQIYLAKRTRFYAAYLSVNPRLINTRTYRARWGCCSNRREITYNWQIIMAPEHIIDYVIVHELCHIKEHNHSKAFWTQVENMMPDYKERKKWLDQNGHGIHF